MVGEVYKAVVWVSVARFVGQSDIYYIGPASMV